MQYISFAVSNWTENWAFSAQFVEESGNSLTNRVRDLCDSVIPITIHFFVSIKNDFGSRDPVWAKHCNLWQLPFLLHNIYIREKTQR